MIIFNEVPEEVISEKHICYFTTESYDKISLIEVFEKKLLHPQAKEHAYVFKLDTRTIKTLYRNDIKAAAIVSLEAAQNNTYNIHKKGENQ